MPDSLRAPSPALVPLPIAPSEQQWQAMTLSEREIFLVAVNTALRRPGQQESDDAIATVVVNRRVLIP